MPEAAGPTGGNLRRRRAAIAVFCALVVAPLVAGGVASTIEPMPGGRVLEIEMRATGGTVAQLFWTSDWGFYPEQSTVLPLHQHPGSFEVLRFPLPAQRLEYLRFDLLDGPGEATIRAVRVVDRQGRVVRRVDPMLLLPFYQIARQIPEGDGVRIVTEPNANDPMLLLKTGALTAPPHWYSLAIVTPFWVAWTAAAVVGLLATGVGFVVRDLRGGPIAPRHVLWFATLFVALAAAKLTLLRDYPMPVPFWDQWDGEAMGLYLPYASDALAWRQMFTLHNEHRIFFTRVLSLALLGVNGQWDPQLQILAGITLHAVAATVLAAACWMAAGRRWLPLIVLGVLACTAPPFALENTLAGFQSAFYFLVLWTVVALWLMTSREPGAPGWWLGWFFALGALFTVAGGILTTAALGVNAVLRLAAQPRHWRRSLLEFAALGVVAAIGYAALAPPLPYHAYLKAASPSALGLAFAHNLGFPWIDRVKPAGLLWLPVGLLTLLALVRRLRVPLSDRWTLVLGAWVVVQAAALAYSRGASGAVPASRYLDMLALGLVANLLALLLLVGGAGSRRRTVAAWVVGIGWLAVAGAGAWRLGDTILERDGHERRSWMRQYVRNVEQFVATDDAETFLSLKGPQQIPYALAPLLAGVLEHPYMRSILPAAVRAPLRLQPDAQAGSGFAKALSSVDDEPVWESSGAGRAAFASAPIRCDTLPYLVFPVVGPVGADRLDLRLRDAGTNADHPVRAGPAGRGGWSHAVARCPSGAFSVVAEDNDPMRWYAFGQPSAIGWASVLTLAIIGRASWVVFAALGLAGLSLGLTLTQPGMLEAGPPSDAGGRT